MRGGAEVACQAHNLKVVGSIPAPATILILSVLASLNDFNGKLHSLFAMFKLLPTSLSELSCNNKPSETASMPALKLPN